MEYNTSAFSTHTPHRATTVTTATASHGTGSTSDESRPTPTPSTIKKAHPKKANLRMRRLGTWVAVTMSGVIFLQGCTISHHGNKQSESEKQISEFNKRNAKYSANNNDGSEPDDSIRWVDRTKTSPLVLVAPHATNHHRRGRPKVADLYTGGITEMVADKLHALRSPQRGRCQTGTIIGQRAMTSSRASLKGCRTMRSSSSSTVWMIPPLMSLCR